MKRLIFLLMFAAAVVPAWAIAANPDPTKNASADCTALRAKMGPVGFSLAYATFGACVTHFAPVEQANNTSANTSCTALQSDANFVANHSGKSFAQFYGTGKNGNNAFGNCVSTFAKTSSQTEQQGRLSPSQSCRALRTTLGASFAKTYGTNADKSNAFGKCVSKQAHAQSQNEVSASASCQAAQTADAQAFSQTYGSNADKSDAFGKCVSTIAAEKSTAQQQATISAAQQCSAEQKAGLSAFTVKYGTFGHCVSQKASSK